MFFTYFGYFVAALLLLVGAVGTAACLAGVAVVSKDPELLNQARAMGAAAWFAVGAAVGRAVCSPARC